MTASSNDPQRLIQDIRRAFQGVQRGSISLHQARLLDDVYYPTSEQLEEAGAKDTDDRWEDVPDEFVEELSDALTFLDAPGRRYYLPRFMIYAIHPPSTSTPQNDYAVHAAFDKLVNIDTYRDEFDEFTVEQSEVISRFLQYMSNQGYSHFTPDDAMRELDDATCRPEDVLASIIAEYWNRR